MAKKSKSSTKFNLKKFAPIFLWISGLFLLTGGILLLVKLIAAMGLFTISNPNIYNWGLVVCLAVVIIGPAIFALIDPGRVRTLLTGRQARYGSNALILLIAFIGILFVINLITYQNPMVGDWTEGKQHTLAPETLKTLKELPAPVQAIAFYTASNTASPDATTLLSNVKAASRGKFNYQMIDPNQNPVEANTYKVITDGTIVFVMGKEQESITSATEQDLTNALNRMLNPTKKSVYFLTGHGEGDIQTASQTSFTDVQTALVSNNYTVQSLNLRAQNQIPADAKAIVIAGPTGPIPADEVTLLQNYLAKGGSLILLDQSPFLGTASTTSDPLADYLASTWGIKMDNDMVIDPNTNPANFAVADTSKYGNHPITSQLMNKTTFFPNARSLSITSISNVNSTPLVLTTSNSYGKTDVTDLQNNQLVFNSQKDLAGPLTLAAAAQNTTTNGRVVVFGSSEFANDTYYVQQYYNNTLIMNTIDWAAGQETMINLSSRQPITRSLNLISSFTKVMLIISFLILLPGLVLAAGIGSWLVRRSRG